MLELIPFAESECLVCVFLGPKGRWFLLNQISRLVFGWDTRVFKRKILYNAMTTKNKYRIIKVSDSYLLEQLKAINMVDRESKHVHLIHIASLDSFIKSYSRRLSLFTKLYDTVHRLQWGNSSNNYEEYGTYTKSSKTAKRKRTLTMADKKYVASLQNWLCAWCAETLPARFEVDHIMQFAEGGSDDVENLQALCPNCHSVKTEMDRRVQRQQDEYETTALLYEDDDRNNNTNRSFKAPAKRSPPLLGNKKLKPNINLGPVRMTQSQKQDSDDEEIGFADILVNDEDEEDDEDDTLTRVNKKAKTSPNDSFSNKNTARKNDKSTEDSSRKPMRTPITSSFFGNHVAAARKISSPPNRLQPSQSQEITNEYDKGEGSSDEDLVLPRHMQEDDEDSDDQSPDPRFEKSFLAITNAIREKGKESKSSGKSNDRNNSVKDNENNGHKNVKKARFNPFEAGLDEDTQVLPLNELSSDNDRGNYDEDEDMNGGEDIENNNNNNAGQLRSDNDNSDKNDNDIVDDEGENNNEDDEEENNGNNPSGDNNEGDNSDDGADSDQDLFPSQKSVKVVSTKTGEWTSISPHFAAKELANPKTRHLQTLKVNQSLALNALKHRVMTSNVPDKNSVLGNGPIRTTPEKTASVASKKKSSAAKTKSKAASATKPKKKITDAALQYEKMLKDRQKK